MKASIKTLRILSGVIGLSLYLLCVFAQRGQLNPDAILIFVSAFIPSSGVLATTAAFLVYLILIIVIGRRTEDKALLAGASIYGGLMMLSVSLVMGIDSFGGFFGGVFDRALLWFSAAVFLPLKGAVIPVGSSSSILLIPIIAAGVAVVAIGSLRDWF